MEKIITWLIVFTIIYLAYILFVIVGKKKKEKIAKNTYINYLIRVYRLDKSKLNLNKLIHVVAVMNAFIIATTFVIISFVKNFIIMMALAVAVLIPLQLLVYHVIGKIVKGSEKNV